METSVRCISCGEIPYIDVRQNIHGDFIAAANCACKIYGAAPIVARGSSSSIAELECINKWNQTFTKHLPSNPQTPDDSGEGE